jgi:hypothetical protein
MEYKWKILYWKPIRHLDLCDNDSYLQHIATLIGTFMTNQRMSKMGCQIFRQSHISLVWVLDVLHIPCFVLLQWPYIHMVDMVNIRTVLIQGWWLLIITKIRFPGSTWWYFQGTHQGLTHIHNTVGDRNRLPNCFCIGALSPVAPDSKWLNWNSGWHADTRNIKYGH